MTVLAMMVGLVPVLWSTGTGADVMKRIAAPMVGGLVTSFLLELTVYPAIFAIWKSAGYLGHEESHDQATPLSPAGVVRVQQAGSEPAPAKTPPSGNATRFADRRHRERLRARRPAGPGRQDR